MFTRGQALVSGKDPGSSNHVPTGGHHRTNATGGAATFNSFVSAALLRRYLRILAGVLALQATLGVAFLAVNKTLSGIVCLLAIVFLVLIPALVLRSGRVRGAAQFMFVCGMILAAGLALISGGTRSPAMVLQITMVVNAAMILGRRWAMFGAGALLSVDIGIALFQFDGGQLPLLLPMPPLAGLIILTAAFVSALPVVILNTDWLRNALAERQRLSEELLFSQQMLARSQEVAHFGTFQRDLPHGETFWSPELFRITGTEMPVPPRIRPWAPRPGCVREFYRMLSGDARQSMRAAIMQAELGQPSDLVYSFTRPDGAIRYHHIFLSPTFGPEGTVIRLNGTVQDITEQETARLKLMNSKAALRESEERYALVMQAAADGIFDRDLLANTVYYSPRWKEILGYRDEEIPNGESTFRDRLHPDDSAVLEAIDRDLKDHRVTRTQREYRLRHKDGDYRWVRSRSQLLRDHDGRAVRLLGSIKDISEQKDAQTKLAASEQRLRDVFDSLFAFGSISTTDGILIDVNRASLESGGVRAEDVVGMLIWETPWWRHSEEERSRLKKMFERAAHGEIVRFEGCARGRDGQDLIADIMFGPLRDENGVIRHVLGFGVDITDRKRVEDELRAREQQLELVFNSTSDMQVLFRVEAAERFTIEAINWAYRMRLRKQHSLDIDDVLGKARSDVLERFGFPQDLIEFEMPFFRNTVKHRQVVTYNFKPPNGSVVLEMTLYPILDLEDRCTHILWVGRDVTQRIRSEGLLRASLLEKETLLKEVHHRVKNNLQIISSLLHFHAKKAAHSADASIFREAQDRLRSMILLHDKLYRSDNLSSVHFGDYLRSLGQQLAHSYQIANHDIQLEISSVDVLMPAETALPCGMIVNELLSNAFKYAFPKGRSGNVCLQVERPKNHLVISVKDDGVGLPSSRHGKSGSFGMELIQNLSEQLGGKLKYHSGVGTRVTLDIPYKEHGHG